MRLTFRQRKCGELRDTSFLFFSNFDIIQMWKNFLIDFQINTNFISTVNFLF